MSTADAKPQGLEVRLLTLSSDNEAHLARYSNVLSLPRCSWCDLAHSLIEFTQKSFSNLCRRGRGEDAHHETPQRAHRNFGRNAERRQTLILSLATCLALTDCFFIPVLDVKGKISPKRWRGHCNEARLDFQEVPHLHSLSAPIAILDSREKFKTMLGQASALERC